jgi:dGTPase
LQQPDKNGQTVAIDSDAADQVLLLKQITRDYVIDHPSLVAQQKGQELVLTTLFDRLFDDSSDGVPSYLPHRLRYLWDLAP